MRDRRDGASLFQEVGSRVTGTPRDGGGRAHDEAGDARQSSSEPGRASIDVRM